MKAKSVDSAESLPYRKEWSLYLVSRIGTNANPHFAASVCSNAVFAHLFLHR
jgi:hypothetical protein